MAFTYSFFNCDTRMQCSRRTNWSIFGYNEIQPGWMKTWKNWILQNLQRTLSTSKFGLSIYFFQDLNKRIWWPRLFIFLYAFCQKKIVSMDIRNWTAHLKISISLNDSQLLKRYYTITANRHSRFQGQQKLVLVDGYRFLWCGYVSAWFSLIRRGQG